MGVTENEGWVCFFFALVFLFLWMHYSAAVFCALALPRSFQSFCTFFVTATAFLTVLLHLTRPKARVTHLHSCHSLAVGMI